MTEIPEHLRKRAEEARAKAAAAAAEEAAPAAEAPAAEAAAPAADGDSKISQSYDAVSTTNPARSARTSYVISPKGEVIYSYTDGNYAKYTQGNEHSADFSLRG